jgi:hypothetical protein
VILDVTTHYLFKDIWYCRDNLVNVMTNLANAMTSLANIVTNLVNVVGLGNK